MKKFKFILYSITCILLSNSCNFNMDYKGFEFKNFENTPLQELAIAVKTNNVEEIKVILKSKKIEIDLKEPVWQQTLLTLAIVNRKKEAFIELLKAGANPNILIGSGLNSTPFNESIREQKKGDFFYIKYLLKNGANPNLEILPNDGKSFDEYYPIFTAINKGVNNDDSTDLIKVLLSFGADINCCSPRPMNDSNCEGVIVQCLNLSCINYLRFFIIEKKIRIPKIAYVTGGINESSQLKYTLTEILNTEDFKFLENPSTRKKRNEILEYLKKTGQQ